MWPRSKKNEGLSLLRTPIAASTLLVLLLVGASACGPVQADISAAENGAAGAAENEAPAARKAVVVETTPAATRDFAERLSVQGDLKARTSAKVGPKLPGTLAEVSVREGDAVTAGETVLFRTDDARLNKAVETNRLALALAKTGIREAQARKAQVEVELKKTKRDYERFKTLHEASTVTDDALEQMETRYEGTKASHKHTKVLVQLAREQQKQAAVVLAISEQDLADATVLAPFNGVVTERLCETGEMGTPGTPVVHIHDLSVVEVSAFLPASYYAQVSEGTTMMKVRVYGQELGARKLSYKSPTIDSKTRTFEVRSLLENSDGRVAPGAMAQIAVTLSEKTALGVPIAAVVERSGRSYVFVAQDDIARMLPVERGIESDGWVAVSGEGIQTDTPIVTRGQSMLDDGSPIRFADQ